MTPACMAMTMVTVMVMTTAMVIRISTVEGR